MLNKVENNVAKGEIARHEQKEHFLNFSQCFQLFAVIIRYFIVIFCLYANMFLKSSAAGFLYVGKDTHVSFSKIYFLKSQRVLSSNLPNSPVQFY